MAFKINDEGNSIEVFLSDITNSVRIAEDAYLKKSGQILKKNIVNNLNRLKTKQDTEQYTHMADDVQARIGKDKFGNKVMKIRGGKLTGTKWHLVNDGTYKSRPTHFMDFAVAQSETDLEALVDAEIKKAGL